MHDALRFELSFPRGRRPFLVTLRADVGSPFIPQPRPVAGAGAGEDGTGSGAADGDELAPVEIDLEGIEDRVVAFPMPEARYLRVAGIEGKVLLSSVPVRGALETTPFDTGDGADAVLEVYDFDKQKTEQLADAISDFTLDARARTMLLRVGKRLRVLPAGAKLPENGQGSSRERGPSGEKGHSRESGWVDLERVRVPVRPAAEWRQMFREAWRLQRDHFYDPGMAGVDWEGIYQRYLPLVDRVGSRAELSDLLWEFQGELGTSHAYEMGGDYPERTNYRQGQLGVDWRYDAASGRFVIDGFARGDPWDPEASSPLMRPGIDVQPGDAVLAIDGRAIGAVDAPGAPDEPGAADEQGSVRAPGEPLVDKAHREVELTLARPDAEPWTATVRAAASERGARYRDWVEGNRAEVRARTDGRVGYLHIPNMQPLGYAEFHRSFLTEYDQDALIVDIRFNGGGNVSPLLLEKLARRRTGQVISRWSEPVGIPRESPRGPLVAVTNENAGSDGDIFGHRFKLLGLGPLIGKRSWGGVVGIAPRHQLVDGTVTTQPEFYMTYVDIGWDLENTGTEPDIEVGISPRDYMDGRDPQLERAIEVALNELAERGSGVGELPERPDRRPPRLGPRPQDS